MLHPTFVGELGKARSETLRAEAARDRRTRRVPSRQSARLRLVLGHRLVSAGQRLLGDLVEVG